MRHAPAIATAVIGCTTAIALYFQQAPAPSSASPPETESSSIQLAKSDLPASLPAAWQDGPEEDADSEDEQGRLQKTIDELNDRLIRLQGERRNVSREYWISELAAIREKVDEIRERGGELMSAEMGKLERRLNKLEDAPRPRSSDDIAVLKQPDSTTIVPGLTPNLSAPPSIASRPQVVTQPRVAESLKGPPPGTSLQAAQPPSGQFRAMAPPQASPFAPQASQYAPQAYQAQQLQYAPRAAVAPQSLTAAPTAAAPVTSYRVAVAATAPATAVVPQRQQLLVYIPGRTRYRLQRLETDGFDLFGLGSLFWVKYQEPGRYVLQESP